MHSGILQRARAFFLVLSTLLVATLLVGVQPAEPATAADASQWNPGYIISDQNFYAGSAMTADGVQAFLATKGGGLRNYSESVAGLASNAYCGAIGAGQFSAAQIIAAVGAACNISQKVLIVLLQKEQSLITTASPSTYQLTYATGFGCPDTPDGCANAPAGFFRQVYAAGRMFNVYRQLPGSFNYRAGRTNTIQLNPNAGCGTNQVYIQNDATAGLYDYTPYVPNGAALANLYGTGDSCSAYGNRNFWRIYTDWFGATTGMEVYGAIKTKYDQFGGATGYIGNPTSSQICGLVENGCYQIFQGANIYSSDAGTFTLRSAVGAEWSKSGAMDGPLGYPTSDAGTGSDYVQTFEGGSITVAGGVATVAPPSDAFATFVWNNRVALGNRLSARICGQTGGGCYQIFQNDNVYSSPGSGLHTLRPQVGVVWSAAGAMDGPLGYPTSDAGSGTDYVQTFQGGTITVTGNLARVSNGGSDPWLQAWAANPWMGTPLTARTCGLPTGSCSLTFSNAVLYDSPGGIHPVRPEVSSILAMAGGAGGPLGYPTNNPGTGADYVQTFQNGTITVSGGVARPTAATDPWVAKWAANPWIGAPISPQYCDLVNSGCYQVFANANIYKSASSGIFTLKPEVGRYWTTVGQMTGSLGYPISDASATGDYIQAFQGGLVMVNSGVAAAADAWSTLVWSKIDQLGATKSPKICGLVDSGCYQIFDKANLYQSAGAGAHTLRPEVGVVWSAAGAMSGPLGYPTTDAGTGASYVQQFQGGTIAVTDGVAKLTSASDPFTSAVAANPWLGAAKSAKICGLPGGGCYQIFTSGNVYWSSATGAHILRSEVGAVWSSFGAFNGSLGLPTTDAGTGTDYVQQFQGGTITVTGGVAKLTASTDPFFAAVAANPWLGAATSAKICGLPGGGCYQIFTSGNIYWSSATGAHTLRSEVGAVWSGFGAFNGALGLPTTDAGTGTDYVQQFQGGTITVTGGVAKVTASTDPFIMAVVANPWLGAATSAKLCGLPGNGCYQIFAAGNVYWSSATGAHTLRSAVGAVWSSFGAFNGSLGLPTTDAGTGTDYVQQFQGGTITVTGGVAVVTASTDPFFAAVAANPWLGAAKSAKICGLPGNGCYQIFTSGNVYWSRSTGAHTLRAAVGAVWSGLGAYSGVLGLPTNDAEQDGDYLQTFQGGEVEVVGGVGRTSTADPFAAAVAANPWLGAAKSAKICGLPGNGCYQIFTSGNVYWSTGTGAHTLRSEVGAVWSGLGAYSGSLGLPTNDAEQDSDYLQTFQGGSIVVTAGVGHLVS